MILTWEMDPDHSPLLSLKLDPRIPENFTHDGFCSKPMRGGISLVST